MIEGDEFGKAQGRGRGLFKVSVPNNLNYPLVDLDNMT